MRKALCFVWSYYHLIQDTCMCIGLLPEFEEEFGDPPNYKNYSI